MPIATDALVIGAGPVGLFQVFQLGLQGIQAHAVDSLPQPGGQCVALYADKPIYDIPAVQVCTGRELTERLLRQIAPFDAPLHLGQEVSALERSDDGRFHIATSGGTRFVARTVFIAGGVGSFQPKRLRVPALEPFEGTQLLYRMPEAEALVGQRVVVVGGDEVAVDAVLALAPTAGSIALLHRRDMFDAAPASLTTLKVLRETGQIEVVAGQISGGETVDGRLLAVDVMGAEGGNRRLPVDTLLVFLGLSPKLGPIATWGLALERKQLVVDTEKFQTSIPGIFAVGDVNTYAGKKKLIVSGFHEATLAAFAAAAQLFPERNLPLQYTTSSTTLQRRLGVLAPADAPPA